MGTIMIKEEKIYKLREEIDRLYTKLPQVSKEEVEEIEFKLILLEDELYKLEYE